MAAATSACKIESRRGAKPAHPTMSSHIHPGRHYGVGRYLGGQANCDLEYREYGRVVHIEHVMRKKISVKTCAPVNRIYTLFCT